MSKEASPPAALDLLARHRAYKELVSRLRALIHRHVPPGATVAVVSKGDGDLVSLVGRQGWHFPQDGSGGYVGYHPRDSASAIAELESLRSRGADFLVLPATSGWWLEHYADFANHLRLRYQTLVEQEDTGVIYALRRQSEHIAGAGGSLGSQPEGDLEAHRDALLAQQVADLTAHLVPPAQPVCIVHPAGTRPLEIEGRATLRLELDGSSDTMSPAQSGACLVARLKSLRREGAACLIVPHSAFAWWALHVEFRSHVEQEYRCITRQAHVCLIYEFQES